MSRIIQQIDHVPFKMKEEFDFRFLQKYGTVFKVFDDQDSGNICFGTEKNGQKYFVKFAGAPTAEYDGHPADAVKRLQATLPIYQDIMHKNLIKLIDAEAIGGGFAMRFKWADGVCMGRMYEEDHREFMALPITDRHRIFEDIADFLNCVHNQNYVAVDFYDGSIMYDRKTRQTTICDIDFFRKKPCVNDMGRMWGSSVFMSPEEFTLGAPIDEVTNIYTLGAVAFALFGNYKRTRDQWTLNNDTFKIITEATSDNRSDRRQSISQLLVEWKKAIETI